MRYLLENFTTAYLAVLATILIHGAVSIFFITKKMKVPDVAQTVSQQRGDLELKVDEDFLIAEEESPVAEEASTPAQTEEIRNANVNESSSEERSMENYQPWNAESVDEEIRQKLKNIEQEEIGNRREQGYNLREFDEFDPTKSTKNDRNSQPTENGSSGGAMYAGTATVSYDLGGRMARGQLAAPSWKCREGGTVVIDVFVDPYGSVVDLRVNEGKSASSACLRQWALSYAKDARFVRDENRPKKHQGTITYRFIPQ